VLRRTNAFHQLVGDAGPRDLTDNCLLFRRSLLKRGKSLSKETRECVSGPLPLQERLSAELFGIVEW